VHRLGSALVRRVLSGCAGDAGVVCGSALVRRILSGCAVRASALALTRIRAGGAGDAGVVCGSALVRRVLPNAALVYTLFFRPLVKSYCEILTGGARSTEAG
jgi:tryptophan synthase alpha subunit